MFTDKFAIRLLERRRALGISRRRLSILANVPEDFVRSAERGQNLATLRKLQQLVSALAREESLRQIGTISQNLRNHVKNR